MSEHSREQRRGAGRGRRAATLDVSEEDSALSFADIFPDVSENDPRAALVDDCRPDEQTIRREREAARELRESQWWKGQIALGICHYCGRKFKSADLTMDHIVPVSRGGRSIRSNVVPCCKECNSRKKYLLPSEMVELPEKQNNDNNDAE